MKIKLDRPVIVEGKYDKIKLSSFLDAVIITTDGFGIFNNEEKRAMIKMLANERGIIVATDSDGAGRVIRSHLRGLVPADKIFNVYTPCVKGKEKRKTAPSKEGLLGVEGTDLKTLIALFAPFEASGDIAPKMSLSPADMYSFGLSGGNNSANLRDALCKSAGLPAMSCKALREAVCMLFTEEQFKILLSEAKTQCSTCNPADL